MLYEQVKPVVEQLKGSTFAGIDTTIEVKLLGGKKNEMQGRVQKHTVGANVILFNNIKGSAYEAMVRRRMMAEGKDQEEFELKPRKWGERVGSSPFIEHNGKYYIEVFFRSPGKVYYTLDGEEISKEDIVGLPVKKESDEPDESQGSIEDKVIIRTYALDSITKMNVLNESLVS